MQKTLAQPVRHLLHIGVPFRLILIVHMTKIALVANTDWYLFNFRLSLAKYLHKQGMQVILVSPDGRFVSKIREAGFEWYAWNVGRKSMNPWSEVTALRKIREIYQRAKPDIVHHHTIKPVLYGSWTAKKLGVPVTVNSITGRGYIFSSTDLKARTLRVITKKLYQSALPNENCGIIFENEADRRFFHSQNILRSQSSWVIEGVGVDPARFFPKPEPEGPVVILLPARMLWDKGVGVMVEAARIIHQATSARVVLAGEIDPGNPAAIDSATLKRWNQEEIIEWWGWQEQMEPVYAASHIVTLPSFHEGVPTVLIEGAACGKPIVASDIPGCRTVVVNGINGFLVPPHSPTALAEALLKLIKDPELRRKMGAAGRELVLKKFDNQMINSATVNVYQSLGGVA